MLLLGGSFDPVHYGHTAIARYFCALLHPDELRLLPAGQPWQKPDLATPAEHRIAMLKLAFADWSVPLVVDDQEVKRDGISYAVDTLAALRHMLGRRVALVMLIGADQLRNLHTWRDWRMLFDLANICVAARPEFDLDGGAIHHDVADQFTRRIATPSQLRSTPYGLTYIAHDLAMPVSSTVVRHACITQDAAVLKAQLPPPVLDYIQHHHLYQTPR